MLKLLFDMLPVQFLYRNHRYCTGIDSLLPNQPQTIVVLFFLVQTGISRQKFQNHIRSSYGNIRGYPEIRYLSQGNDAGNNAMAIRAELWNHNQSLVPTARLFSPRWHGKLLLPREHESAFLQLDWDWCLESGSIATKLPFRGGSSSPQRERPHNTEVLWCFYE